MNDNTSSLTSKRSRNDETGEKSMIERSPTADEPATFISDPGAGTNDEIDHVSPDEQGSDSGAISDSHEHESVEKPDVNPSGVRPRTNEPFQDELKEAVATIDKKVTLAAQVCTGLVEAVTQLTSKVFDHIDIYNQQKHSNDDLYHVMDEIRETISHCDGLVTAHGRKLRELPTTEWLRTELSRVINMAVAVHNEFSTVLDSKISDMLTATDLGATQISQLNFNIKNSEKIIARFENLNKFLNEHIMSIERQNAVMNDTLLVAELVRAYRSDLDHIVKYTQSVVAQQQQLSQRIELLTEANNKLIESIGTGVRELVLTNKNSLIVDSVKTGSHVVESLSKLAKTVVDIEQQNSKRHIGGDKLERDIW